MQVAESTFVANMQAGAHIEMKSDAAGNARKVIAIPTGHAKDNTTLATWNKGSVHGGPSSHGGCRRFPPIGSGAAAPAARRPRPTRS